MPIQVLDPNVAAKIAAGEVVERPASVVKELIDNAIDAGAGEVRVEIRDGGKALIRITDNGSGIPAEEIPLAFLRHATSKIRTAEELFALHTLGFRGEALASISAVARVTLSTRTADAAVGHELTVEGGAPGQIGPRGMPRGTIVTVRDLFFNVPARLKFLKSGPSEAAHITALIQEAALAYPALRLTLLTDDKQVFQSTGSDDLREAIRQVYGPEIARVMLPVGVEPDSEPALSADPFADWENPDALPGPRRAGAALARRADSGEEPPVLVWGYASPPSISRTNRQAQHFFVNGRAINSRMLTIAVEEAYHSLLMVNRRPLAVLNIRVDPADVDANVHPTKSEVKFRQERQVFITAQRAVREALAAHAPVPAFGTRGGEGWAVSPGATPAPALPDTSAADGPAGDDAQSLPQRGVQGALDLRPEATADWSAWADTGEGAPAAGAPAEPLVALAGDDTTAPPAPGVLSGAGLAPRLPPLRVVGQVSNTYLITEGPDGLFLIDQHAAHERVLYERLDREIRLHRIPVQPLLQPLHLSLTAHQRANLEPLLPLLTETGFELELVRGRENSLEVRAVPAMFADRAGVEDLLEMVDELLVGSPPDRWRDQLTITLACHSAIRAGKALAPEEMRALVSQLEQCRFPRLCAHGRPTMLHLSALQLEREFARRG